MSPSCILPAYRIIQMAPQRAELFVTSAVSSLRAHLQALSVMALFSSELLTKVLNSETPTNDPRGPLLNTHQLRDDSLHLPPRGDLSVLKPLAVGYCSFCLLIKMQRSHAPTLLRLLSGKACNLSKMHQAVLTKSLFLKVR